MSGGHSGYAKPLVICNPECRIMPHARLWPFTQSAVARAYFFRPLPGTVFLVRFLKRRSRCQPLPQLLVLSYPPV